MKKLLFILGFLMITSLYAQSIPNYYYASGTPQYWTEDSTSVNIIVGNMRNYDAIVRNLELLFTDPNDEILADDEDDNIIVNSRSLLMMDKNKIIDAISIDPDDIVFFTYSKLVNNERIWLRNDVYVKPKNKGATLYSLFPIIQNYSNISVIEEEEDFRIICETEEDVVTLANTLHDTTIVIYSTPDFYSNIKRCSTDPYFSDQWGLKNTGQAGGIPGIDIKAEQAWNFLQTVLGNLGANIKVAVIDDGVEEHEDLYLPGGINKVLTGWTVNGDGTGRPRPSSFHGQCCAGIISATHNDKGVAGVAPNTRIVPIRIVKENGNFFSKANIAKGITKAWKDLGAQILSNSWADMYQHSKTKKAIEDAVDNGIVVVAASGNNFSNYVRFPAGYPTVIAVGAVNSDGKRADFSNYGTYLDIVAPGNHSFFPLDLGISTIDREGTLGSNSSGYPDYSNKNYTKFFGRTSAACPHVAGVAALVLSANPTLTGLQVRDIIESTARKVNDFHIDNNPSGYLYGGSRPNGTWHAEVGYGMVNAEAAVKKAYFLNAVINGSATVNACGTAFYSYSGPSTSNMEFVWSVGAGLEIISGQGTQNVTIRSTAAATMSSHIYLAFWVQNTHLYSISKNINISGTNHTYLSLSNFDVAYDRTWDKESTLGVVCTVKNGATLTITSTIHCAENAKFIVESGGKIVIDGGILTNSCPGQMWQGIVVSNNNCSVEIKNNGKIEHAICGITVNAGNIVSTTGAQFINNKAGVKFNTSTSSGTFAQTNFTLNNSYFGNTTDFETHLKMEGSGQVSVTGCTFSSHVALNANNGVVVSNSSTNWSGTNKLLSVPLAIQSGATLTNTGIVNSNQNTVINVHPKGKLIINGGTFNHNSAGTMWQGITVMGNSSLPISQTNQGYLQITNNGKIENAITGITVNGGGIVNSDGAKFINNKAGVKFEQIAPGQSGTSGSFTNTEFTLNSSYFGNTSTFDTHLKMEGSGQVSVTGCTFSSHVVLNPDKGIVVSNCNTSWSGNNKLSSVPVALNAGATLTNTGTISSDQNTVINVHPKGSLILNGGTFTNAISGTMWQGVNVLGDPTKPLMAIHQGYLYINNGTIRNAITGINVNDGGIVSATNANFVNNQIGVKFGQLAKGQSGTSGTFTLTSFTLDNAYLGNPALFEAHIKMQNSGDVFVKGCEFSSTIQSTVSVMNNGIKATNSYLDVKEHCPMNAPWPYGGLTCDENFITRNSFSGFSYAISSVNAGSGSKLYVRYSDFNNNLSRGISISGTNYATVIKNEFGVDRHLSYGVSVSNATGFKIEENIFTGLTSPSPSNATIGLVVNNSGSAENEVYKNEYTNFFIGQEFISKNSSQIDTVPCTDCPPQRSLSPGQLTHTGLQTLCNTFNNNQYSDIFVGFWGQNYYNMNSIRDKQGSPQVSAGNKFNSTPTRNINNDLSQHYIDYYWKTYPIEYPNTVTSKVTRILANAANSCPSKLVTGFGQQEIKGGEGIEDLLSKYNEWNAMYEYWLALLLVFEGEENTEEYNMLLSNVSHYSSIKDNYFNWIIASAINEEQTEGNEEEKEKRENEKARKYEGTKGESGHGSLYEKLRFLFGYRGHYIDNLSIVETYFAENNYDEALVTLAKIYKQFEVTEEQIMELNGLEIYAHWLKQLEKEEKSIYALSERELDYLVNYVRTNTGRGKVFANNILCMLYGICMEEEPPGSTIPQEDPIIEPIISTPKLQIDDKALLDKITLIPNPTTGELRIESGEMKVDKVEILDVVGRVIFSQNFTSSSYQKIDISHINSGVYFVRLTTEQGKVVKKVVKQ